MDHIATGIKRQNIVEVAQAIERVAELAASKQDHTCMALAGILYALTATINGGGLGEWVAFSQQFGEKMLPIWTAQLAGQNN